MEIRASVLFEEFKSGGLLLDRSGADPVVVNVASADACGPGDLVFAEEESYAKPAVERGASLIITTPEIASKLKPGKEAAILTCSHVKLARALIGQKHFDRAFRDPDEPRIHPAAVVHEKAQVSNTAFVGPGAVIQKGAKLGDESVAMANAVVERDAVLGDRSILHPNTVLGFNCEVGRNCIIMSGTVIGSEGYGFAQDESRKNHRIPQMGRVLIGDDVVVGSNCSIDRGTVAETRIGNGTAIDNLCHIAHNVTIGENCILMACLCVAGSTTLGNRVITSGQTGILDHLTIADDTVLLHRAGVNTDIKEPGMYAGAPHQPLKSYMKNTAAGRRHSELRAAVKELERKLAEK